jgi:hypothetical protein
MDTLVMPRTLTEAGMPSGQAAGFRHELSVAVVKIESRIERLENKLNLLFGVAILAVLAPAVTRLIVGS